MFSRSRSAETKSAQLKQIATDGLGCCLMTDESYWRVKIPSPKEAKGSNQIIDLIVQFSREDFSFRPAFYYYPALETCRPVEESAAAFKYYSPGTIYSSKRSIFRPDPDGLHRTPYAITIKAQGSRNMWNNYSLYFDATFWVYYFSVQVTVPANTNLGQIREIVMAHDKFLKATDDGQRNLAKDSLWNQLQQYNPVCQVPVAVEPNDENPYNLTTEQLRNIVENHLKDFDPSIQGLLLTALRSTEPYMAPTVEEGETIFTDAAVADVQPFCSSSQNIEDDATLEFDEDVPEEVLPFAFVNEQVNIQHSPFYGDPEDTHYAITMADFQPSTSASLQHLPPIKEYTTQQVALTTANPLEAIQSKRKILLAPQPTSRSETPEKKADVSVSVPLKKVIPSKRIRISLKHLNGSSTK